MDMGEVGSLPERLRVLRAFEANALFHALRQALREELIPSALARVEDVALDERANLEARYQLRALRLLESGDLFREALAATSGRIQKRIQETKELHAAEAKKLSMERKA